MSEGAAKSFREMGFLDHLDELRKSLVAALVGIALMVVVAYFYAPWLQDMLLIPFREQTSASLALLAPAEGFLVRLKISLVAGIFAAAPWIFYQLWRFVAPGLFSHERKLVLPVIFFSTFLFLTGAAFAVFVLPYATGFFLGFATPEIQNAWSLGRYVDFTLRLLLAFGIVFELPLLLYFLARFGVVTPAFLKTYRRHMYVVFLVGSAFITPPDVFTQVVLSMPLVLLYEISILLAHVAKRKWEQSLELRDEEEEREEEAETGAAGGGEEEQEEPEAEAGEGAASGEGDADESETDGEED